MHIPILLEKIVPFEFVSVQIFPEGHFASASVIFVVAFVFNLSMASWTFVAPRDELSVYETLVADITVAAYTPKLPNITAPIIIPIYIL